MKHRLLLGLAWLGVVGAAAFAATIVTAAARAQTGSCPDDWQLTYTQGEYKQGVKLPSVSADEQDSIDVHFDDTGHDAAGSVLISIPDWKRSQQRHYGLVLKFAGGYLRADKKKISSTDEHLFGNIVLAGQGLAELCLHVKKGMAVHAGRYSGRLQVSAGRDQVLTSVPVELTHRDSWAWAVVFALLGFLVGVTIKALSEAYAGQREQGLGPWEALRAYMQQLVFPLSVLLGLVATAFVFKQVYFDDRGWGGIGGVMTLFGLCFVAQLSSNEGINLVRRAVAPSASNIPTSPPPAGNP
jgi:hypothetical protein